MRTPRISRPPAARRPGRLGRRLAVLGALGVFAVVAWLLPVRELDLAVYWRAAQQAFVAGVEPYTRPDDAGLPFTYLPTALFLLRPLAGLRLAQAADLVWAMNLALAVVVILLLPRDLASAPVGAASLPRPAPPNAARAVAAHRLRTWGPLYIACFGGLYLTLHFQQVNLLLLLCLWGFWRVLRGPSPGGGRISLRSSTLRPFLPGLRGLGAGAALALGRVAKPHYGLLLLGAFGCPRVGRGPGPGLWLLLGAALAGGLLLWLSLALTLDDLIPREVRTRSHASMALMTVAVLGLWALLLERLLRHTAAARGAVGRAH